MGRSPLLCVNMRTLTLTLTLPTLTMYPYRTYQLFIYSLYVDKHDRGIKNKQQYLKHDAEQLCNIFFGI